MRPEDIKNFDKLPEYEKGFVLSWSQVTSVSINDDGIYVLDMMSQPGFSDAILKLDEE